MKLFLRRTKGRIDRFFGRNKLPIALAASTLIALFMTVTSVYMYVSSGVSQLDLSRPGYESIREQVEYNSSRQVFDDEGPVNEDSVDEFLELLNERMDELQNISDFSGQSLDDATLDLNP
jgi:hypothetical protein